MNDEGPRSRIYLDTSVPSHLYATDAPDQRADTWRLWAAIRAGEYDACISLLVIRELAGAPEPKQSQVFVEMNNAKIKTLGGSDEIDRLAAEYVRQGILSAKNYNDCLHLAFASVGKCDALVSWNFRHLVRARTINGVRIVNANNQYGEIAIVSPAILLDGGWKP